MEADKLEEKAVEQLLLAKNKKKKRGASAALAMVRATRGLLERYNK